MKYLSFIRLFEYCGVDCVNLDILRIKKIISAEYSLSDNGIVSIGGFDYTKDAVLQEIEQDDFVQRLQYHFIIWENKALLNFLEQDIINDEANTWYPLSNNAGFKQFISPYFSYSLNKAMHRFLRDADLVNASYLLSFLVFVDYVGENEALTSTRAFISETLKLLKNTSKNNYKNNYFRISAWARPSVFLFINYLPDTLSEERDDLIIALINLTVEIQLKDKRLCLAISENLIRISNVDAENSKIIKKNHSIYKKKVSAGYSIWSVVRWGFIIVGGGKLLIMALAVIIALVSKSSGAGDNDSSKSYSPPVKEYKKTDTIKSTGNRFLDRMFGIKATNERNKKKKKSKKRVSLYQIFYQDFLDINDEHTQMLYDTTNIFVKNEAIPLSVNDLYHFMVENRASKDVSALRLINKSPLPVIFYLTDYEDSVVDFVVSKEDTSFVEIHYRGFDIMVSFLDSLRAKIITEEKVIPVLLSDSIDLSPHIIQTKHKYEVIHICSPEKVYDFTITFMPDSIYIHGKDGDKTEWIYRDP